MTIISMSPLVLSMGDPAGCGPLITCEAWKALRGAENVRPFCVLAPPELYSKYVPVETIASLSEATACFSRALPVLPLDTDLPPVIAGEPVIAAAGAILASISAGVALCQSGEAAGLVTNPINKKLLYEAGFSHPGHTEYLAELCSETGANEPIKPVMMLVGGGLRVALATIHMPLVEA
ncbi:MAG: 4-hydroxythreonine-4-phosphate dehydrogenase PdxA, partial [Hyphomonadaceae bacterium]